MFGTVAAAVAAVVFAALAWFRRRDPYLPRWVCPAAVALMVVDAVLRLSGHPLIASVLVWLCVAAGLVWVLVLRAGTRRMRRETAALRAENQRRAAEALRHLGR